MPSKIRDNVVELNKIQYIEGNNSLNFTATPISGGAPIVDATAGVYANGAFVQANAAYSSSNTKLSTSGGTVNGDLAVAGNLIVSGTRIDINTATVLLNDNIVTINSDLPNNVLPTENAGIEVNRGSSTNVSILWNESTDNWTFTNDGVNYEVLGGGSAGSYANSAFLKANAAFNKANSAVNREAFIANNGQTVFQTNGYNIGYADVFVNGIKLYANTDFTANDGVYVTISDPILEQNDVVEIINWGGTAEPIARVDQYARDFVNNAWSTANSAYNFANSVYSLANNAVNSASSAANSAANSIPLTGSSNISGNLIPISTNTYYLGSETNRWHSLFVGPGSIDIGGLKLSNVGGTLSVSTPGSPSTPIAGEDTWVRAQANAAFAAANSVNVYGANTNATSFFTIPQGTTAQRPASPANGSIRLNTTNRKIEVYIDNYWANITSAVYVVDYLVVAGGGGASGGVSGVNYGAGGAGGTVRVGKLEVNPGVSYTISVGAGGTGAGSNGSSSNIKQTAGQLIVATAGGGEGPGAPSFVGGRNDDYTGGGAQPGFAAVGGGAGGGGSTTTGNGGPAYTWPFNGTAYAGGGGGGQGASHGGGGYGPNSGGGAQGQGSTIPNTAGGSGIIIITYPGPVQRALGGTVTNSNGYYYHTFTGSGTFTA